MDHKQHVFEQKTKVAQLLDECIFGAPEGAPISDCAAKLTDELTLLMYHVCGEVASDLTSRIFSK